MLNGNHSENCDELIMSEFGLSSQDPQSVQRGSTHFVFRANFPSIYFHPQYERQHLHCSCRATFCHINSLNEQEGGAHLKCIQSISYISKGNS